jgi:ubiquinone/menaquinone biosynthesis C-methylase UbiE
LTARLARRYEQSGMATGHPWLARTLDLVMRPMYPARRLVVPEARGRVLEVGVGTGLNFDLYGGVESLTGVDPDPHMLARARPRATTLPFPTTLHEAGAEHMPFADASFDTAVVTFTLCTIPEPEAALAEVRRVVKPGGLLLFVEHARSIQPLVAGVQDGLTPLWKRIGGGCHLNRRAVELVRSAGFLLRRSEPVWRERWTLFPVYRGVAERCA